VRAAFFRGEPPAAPGIVLFIPERLPAPILQVFGTLPLRINYHLIKLEEFHRYRQQKENAILGIIFNLLTRIEKRRYPRKEKGTSLESVITGIM